MLAVLCADIVFVRLIVRSILVCYASKMRGFKGLILYLSHSTFTNSKQFPLIVLYATAPPTVPLYAKYVYVVYLGIQAAYEGRPHNELKAIYFRFRADQIVCLYTIHPFFLYILFHIQDESRNFLREKARWFKRKVQRTHNTKPDTSE